jgi:hypothetical protein
MKDARERQREREGTESELERSHCTCSQRLQAVLCTQNGCWSRHQPYCPQFVMLKCRVKCNLPTVLFAFVLLCVVRQCLY